LVRRFCGSVIGRPVVSSASSIAGTLAAGSFERIAAMAPATCGAAIEVPNR
jgi:hypothetical protein